MDSERLQQLAHALDDVELAMLLCLVARRHCILTATADTATAAADGLQAEVEAVCLHTPLGSDAWLILGSEGSADCSAGIQSAPGHCPLPARNHARRARWRPARQRGWHCRGHRRQHCRCYHCRCYHCCRYHCHQHRHHSNNQTDTLHFVAAVCRCLPPLPPTVQRAGGLTGAANRALRTQAQRLACDNAHGDGDGSGSGDSSPFGSVRQQH